MGDNTGGQQFDNEKGLGEVLRAFRLSLNLSVDQLIEIINGKVGEGAYARLQVYNMEKGNSKVMAPYLVHLSQTFNISIDDLIRPQPSISGLEGAQKGTTGYDKMYLSYIKNFEKSLIESSHELQSLLYYYERAIANNDGIEKENALIKKEISKALKKISGQME